jgi:hydrogenase expression/formation protein HypC
MCLAVPGEVLAFVDPMDELRFARVSFGGVVKQVSLVYVPEANVGDFVLVHAGFAIAQIDEAHAAEVLETLSDRPPRG